MGFRVAQKTLERLEWPQIVARLHDHARTPRGRARLVSGEAVEGAEAPPLFEPSLAAVRDRLAETSEARAILDAGDGPPLSGARDVASALRRAGKGGTLAASELLDVKSTLDALHATAGFLARRRDEAPRLAALADAIADLRALADDIDWSLDPQGEIRDTASPALAEARREARGFESDLQRRMERYLRDPGWTALLSDAFYTVRNDRYVLPVRANARARLPGIVHDASGSGTTLFIEPQDAVELNNRLRRAEIEIERETQRILRGLSRQVAAARDDLDASLTQLDAVDLGFARGQLSRELDAVEPVVAPDGVFVLPQLRHPLLPREEAVPNDVRLGETYSVLILSGPNAGGKTVAMKAVALAALMARAGLHVAAASGARVALADAILADIGDEQDLRESLSTFSAHMANLAAIVAAASPRSLVALDEIGVGTDPGEGAALAQAALEALADAGARVIATTHYNLLKEMASLDPRFANASVSFDPHTLAPTYRLHMGVPGASAAAAVAARMGLRRDILERADALLAREDRQLDRLLSELAASRAALETEKREAGRLHAASEAMRDEYREKLEKLQARRDKLFRSMRDDLERAFRQAHADVAGVIRELQRGGTARDAARARVRLQVLEAGAREAELASGARSPADEGLDPVDWRSARPGDTLRVRSGGTGVLLTLPDRRGRVVLRVGSARMEMPADQLRRCEPAAAASKRGESPSGRRAHGGAAALAPEAGASDRCDLRGLRVQDALDRVEEALDRAAAAGCARISLIHGFGTGALRDSVRKHLAASPYVENFFPGDPERGGDGVTIVDLHH